MRSRLFRLTAALTLRETGGSFAGAVVAATAGAALAAALGPNLLESGAYPRFIAGILLRYDVSLMWAVAILLLLRAGIRIEEDNRDGWLEPLAESLPQRSAYGFGLAFSLWSSSLLVLTAGALAFGSGVLVFGGSDEIIAMLPRRVAVSALLLAGYSTWGVLFAILIRRAVPAFVVAGAAAAAPLVAVSGYAFGSELPPAWLIHTLRSYPQALMAQADPLGAARAVFVSGVFLGLAMLAARRYAGRHT